MAIKRSCEITDRSPLSLMLQNFEKFVQRQFISYLLHHELITVEQSAFIRCHSTVTSLHRVIGDWLKALNARAEVALLFLEIKCFGAISHELYFLRLHYHGVCDTELHLYTGLRVI